MNAWLLDTNVIAEISGKRLDKRVAHWLQSSKLEDMFISVVSLGEYVKGLHKLDESAPRRSRIHHHVLQLEQRFVDRTLEITRDTIEIWGRLQGDAMRNHRVWIDPVDALIAAAAIEHGLVLVTRNVRDMRLTGAAIFNPWDKTTE